MKKTTAIFGVLFIAFAFTSVQAVTPRKWQLQRYEQFLQGKFEHVSLSGEGVLSLAPGEETLAAITEEFLLSLLFSPDGTAYVGTGHAGNIYRIGQDGKAELYFHVPEMDVLCLARDGNGDLFAGTAPNGKIYRITEQGKGAEYFNPKKKYIWDLAFSERGSLLAAVGETGGIYEITGEGQGGMILEAKENHILCMKQTPGGELLAGSGGQGRLYRIVPGKKPAVLFESPFEEIRSIALDDKGTVYAAAGGVVTRPQTSGSLATPSPAVLSTSGGTDVSITVSASNPSPANTPSVTASQPSALYKVEASGIARRIWQSADELIYTLLWDSGAKRVVFGTGGKGRVYTIDADDKPSLMLQKDSEQIYFIGRRGSRFYVLANNPAVFSAFEPEQSYNGEYTSRVFDSGMLSSWGRVEWEVEEPKDTVLQVQTRSGNSGEPNQTWSDWSPPYRKSAGEPNLSPRGRYLQFKIRFKTDSGNKSPMVKRISLFYMQSNVQPRVNRLELLPVNVVFLEPPMTEERIWGLTTGALDKARSKSEPASLAMAKKAERKGYQTLIWSGQDENEDSLVYRLSIRKSDETLWRLLEEGVSRTIYSFESIAFPDGEYFIRLEASDTPSNPVGAELTAEKISRSFVIDNSLPTVRGFKAERSGSVLKLNFTASDSFSRIKEVRVLIRPGDWRTILPADGISDSQIEAYQISLTLPEKFDNLVTVKVIDEHGNTAVQRSSF